MTQRDTASSYRSGTGQQPLKQNGEKTMLGYFVSTLGPNLGSILANVGANLSTIVANLGSFLSNIS